MSSSNATDVLLQIEDLPTGPLDFYRKQSKLNWKLLRLFIETPDGLSRKILVWKTLEKDPLFQINEDNLSTDEMKRRTALQFKQYCKYMFQFLPPDVEKLPYKVKIRCMLMVNEALFVCFPDLAVKFAIGNSLITNTLKTLGTDRHRYIYQAVWDRKILSCLALTEVAHGSNTKQMRTTAIYDKESQEFVINTPDFEAAKCWVGNLGKTCTMAVVFAQLYTADQCHGLHAFVVPIRDPKTLLPYPGIILGDIGEKIGLHGIDNGFILFKNYRIPREFLLNRTADVTVDGDYESSFSEPGKILGAALENLMMGRIGIMRECCCSLGIATTISVRYAATRKQFADNGNGEEFAIIEYQLHQWRLFPYVSASAVFKLFVQHFTDLYLDAVETTTKATSRLESLGDLVAELHAIVSSAKPLISWTCLNAIQESREACGGNGYLKAARLGDLRNSVDPSVTYEGDNNVLSQQTSNWLLRQWSNIQDKYQVCSPLGSCDFLQNHREILNSKFNGRNNLIEHVTTIDYVVRSYQWLITYLISETDKKQNLLVQQGFSKFVARNESQVYRAAVLSKTFAEYLAIKYYWKMIHETNPPRDSVPVLETLGLLFALWSLDKHLIYFYEGNYASGPSMTTLNKEGILQLCKVLKPDIVTVIDSLAPPDYVVNSVLGRSDGKLYHHLETEFLYNNNATSRPSWWKEIIVPDAPDIRKKSKL